MIDKVRAIVALSFVFSSFGLMAQNQDKPLDPAGYVTKYNPAFAGIGPKVYVLPPPRTKEEELVDFYKEKKGFYDSIARQLDFQSAVDDYKFTTNASFLRKNYNPFPTSDQDWNALMTKTEQSNNNALVAGLANEYAYSLLQKGDINKTLAVLTRGLNAAQARGSGEKMALEHNLANAYLLSGNLNEASRMQESFLKKAVDNRESIDQANTLVRIALVQAYTKSYKAAENTIIRKAIPIYNKTKNHAGKVFALLSLSRIYQLQNKHTEAQWFLIQARDLANSRNLEKDLPEIEFMLAYSKYVQENYKVAVAEFEKARTLAENENNKVLKLAIHDKLGDIYLRLGNFKEAEKELASYWQLRRELFQSSEG